MGADLDAEALIREFCDTFVKHDAEALRPYLADDVVYHNIPMDPCVGADATVEFITGFFAMCESMTIEITNMAAHGDVVLTERIDTFKLGDRVGPLPVMGVFELQDGRISKWRDYFDLAQVTRMLTGDE
jgi:limonene-1,2-epoxide hydrolase